jgi:hypothetical protein
MCEHGSHHFCQEATNVKFVLLIAAFLLISPGARAASAQERTTLWQGSLHLGDNPQQYASELSGGMSVQIPCKLPSEKKGRLHIAFRDIQTLAGDGHFADLLAHYEDDDGPGREYVVESFRLKDNSNNVDVVRQFDFDPLKGLQAAPAFYSIRIKLDTQIKFGLWDDFLLKRIEIEQ